MKEHIKSLFNWKVKLTLLATVVLMLFIGFMSMERDNGQTTWNNWLDCIGEGQALERESDYDFLWNKCVTIRVNADGSETRVKANLDVGLEGSSGFE